MKKFHFSELYHLWWIFLIALSACSTPGQVACPSPQKNKYLVKKNRKTGHKTPKRKTLVFSDSKKHPRLHPKPQVSSKNTSSQKNSPHTVPTPERDLSKQNLSVYAHPETGPLIASKDKDWQASGFSLYEIPDLLTEIDDPATTAPAPHLKSEKNAERIHKNDIRKELRKELQQSLPGITGEGAPDIKAHRLAIASGITGALAVISFILMYFYSSGIWGFAGLILPPLAVILGAIALSRIKKHPGTKGKGMAIAGVIIGAVIIIIMLISLLAFFSSGFGI